MERGDFISEAEAMILSGVSAKTLHRFTDAGYLHIDLQHDGMRRYARGEIHEIFGIHRAEITTTSTDIVDISRDLSVSAAIPPSDFQQEHASPTQSAPPGDSSEATDTSTVGSFNERCTDSLAESKVMTSTLSGYDAAEELTRLKNLVALQEKLLDLKDSEVTDLRAQRDWLQRRVEKLEEKGDRDQILLLSETQTIRKLVAMQSEKRSTVRQFLNWIGLSHPNQLPQLAQKSGFGSHGESIAMPRASND